MKGLYVTNTKEKNIQYLKELLLEDISLTRIPREETNKAIKRAEKFDIFIGSRVDREFLENAKNLKYYLIPFAGIPEKDKNNLRDFPEVTVLNCHYNAKYVAEYVFTLLLATARNLIPLHTRLQKGDWRPRYQRDWWGTTLMESTLLLLGYGNIGKHVAKIAQAFEMKVKAIKRTPGDASEIDFLGTNNDLYDILPEADFIVSTLPETESTKGYLGKKEFELMKDGVCLVNVGRGPVIDEKALYDALKSGKMGGVAIDTWWIYPPDQESRKHTFPSHNPLDKFENVVFSPHHAAHVHGKQKTRIEHLAQILNKLSRGEVVNEVHLDQGY